MKQTLRRILGPVIILATIGAFAWYLSTHPETVTQLIQTPLGAIILILALYFVSIVALAASLAISLRFYNKSMPHQENFLLTAYSSIANFFGPGQSGPGVRAIYLKLKHNVTIKQYFFVTFLYYGWFAVISGVFLGIGVLKWWQLIAAALVLTTLSYVVIQRFKQRNANASRLEVSQATFVRLMVLLGLATLVQTLFLASVYFVELRTIDSSISFLQALSYTGAANFALFVSLTPGAIGFREAFLLFSEGIHGIGREVILAASVLDRAVYIVFLGLLFLLVISMHANTKLQLKKVQQAQQAAEKQ